MGKHAIGGMQSMMVTNQKADMRHHKKVYQRGREKAFRKQEIQEKQTEQKLENN